MTFLKLGNVTSEVVTAFCLKNCFIVAKERKMHERKMHMVVVFKLIINSTRQGRCNIFRI